MATHYSILAWEIPRTEEPDRPQSMGWQGLQSMGRKRDRPDLVTKQQQRQTYCQNTCSLPFLKLIHLLSLLLLLLLLLSRFSRVRLCATP